MRAAKLQQNYISFQWTVVIVHIRQQIYVTAYLERIEGNGVRIEELLNYMHNPWIAWPLMLWLGLCFGSYVTLLSYRLPRNLPTVRVRSACPGCGKKLGVADLFPVLSFLWHRGKCAGCGMKISWRYPLTELATAMGFIWAYAIIGPEVWLLPVLGLWVCLMTLIVTDLEHYIIPDELQWAIAVCGVAYVLLRGDDFPHHLYGMALGGLIGLSLRYGFLYLRDKDGLGMGDVKLMAASGIWLGIEPQVPYLFYAGVLGVITAVVWRIFRKGVYYPFGPSLALSLWILVLYHEAEAAFWAGFLASLVDNGIRH